MVKVFPKTKNKYPFSLYYRGLAYRKLPDPHIIKLSVLKLDGSSFSFHVGRNATVSNLKLAIQEEFYLFPMDERDKLWALVWRHFCLCYEGHKLIRDTVCIQKYGIKDGDQLQFIQHLRIDLPPSPKNIESNQCSLRNSRDSGADDHHSTLEDQHTGLKYLNYGEGLGFPERRSRLAHSVKEFLSCSGFQRSKRYACD